MWAQSLRPLRSNVHRTVRFSRRQYNGQNQGQHVTYFQPPPQPGKPPRRIFRSILFGTVCLGVGAYAHSWFFDTPFLGIGDLLDDMDPQEEEFMKRSFQLGAMQEGAARTVPPMDVDTATALLELRATMSVTPKAVSHTCQLPSNMPGEDFVHSGVYDLFKDPSRDWATWSVFDGHA